jgi:sulfate permease, SulP family
MLYHTNEPKYLFQKIAEKTAYAMREKWREGYSLADLKADAMAGLVVGMVAIPLGMALSVASGVAPQYGLYTGIWAGALVALLGGSRYNIIGPTAAFVAILAPIASTHGLAGLLTAGMMSGFLIFFMGLLGLGQAIRLIPHPVTTGFASGIAVFIATLQVKDFFGLKITVPADHFLGRIESLIQAAGTFSVAETAVAASTLALLILWPKLKIRIPAPLVALTIVTVGTVIIRKFFPTFEIATIGTRFTTHVNGVVVHGIPQSFPSFEWPWLFGSLSPRPFDVDFKVFQALIPSAIAIALLGSIESLLTAVVADGMTQTKHDPDAELMALGVANILTPFFGGIAATAAMTRTTTNIRFGARSPIAGVVYSVFCLGVVVLFAPYISYLPMAALAALMMLVAYNMSEIKSFKNIVQVAPRNDTIVLLTCFLLTVIFDMVIGVTFGVLLAALLFMRQMVSFAHGQVKEGPYHRYPEPIPSQIILYEIAGPMFFGAAEKAVANLGAITDKIQVIIFDLEDVPVMDITGLVAFETAIKRLVKHRRFVFLAGLRSQPLELLAKAHVIDIHERVKTIGSVKEAMTEAKKVLQDS